MQESLFKSEMSLAQVAERLVSTVEGLLRTATSEEDLRIGFEKAIDPLCREINIELKPKYEKRIYEGGRSDALHGQVIIEYEAPRSFKSKSQIDHAYQQLVGYIQGEAKERAETLFIFDPKLVGIGFDGEQMFYVQYKGDKNKAKKELDSKDFDLIGPYFFDSECARTFLTYLRSLQRYPLNAEYLAQKFGPSSKIAPQAVSAFVNALQNWGNERVIVFYNEWKRLFGIVYGHQFETFQDRETQAVAKLYNVREDVDFQQLLFGIHTYFALLIKLIAAELITLKESAFSSSFSNRLTHSSSRELYNELENTENGGVYAQRGITNFLEGDFFRWYLDARSPQLEGAIREITRGLSEFEPATTIIQPEATRDLLKKLYQYLVPTVVRHNLGEYYTPDWLAELLLEEVEYDGDTRKRILDPACGSGTFLVLAINRAKDTAAKNKENSLETAKRITSNIWGFDLNPLAVIASRMNYLLALGELAQKLDSFEIPVYLTDSVLWPERNGQMEVRPEGDVIAVTTSLKTFFVPEIWIKNKGLLMLIAAPLVENLIKERYSVSEAMARLTKEGVVTKTHEKVVEHFYRDILELEKQGKNGIWARFLKNAFAPMMAGTFDFVIGNPPWIRWDYLSAEYRKATLDMWKNYGLFSLKGFEARLGGGKKDFSMLFTYASADFYLKSKGTLAFLITQEVFKSKGAGEGFRRFRLGDQGDHLKILKAHDLVSVQPFEGAANKTAMILLRKGEETQYPVDYIIWRRKKNIGKISTEKPLQVVLSLLQKTRYLANPVDNMVSSWQTILPTQKRLKLLSGQNNYTAHSGAYTSPYGVYWLHVEQVLLHDKLIVRNLNDSGKRAILQIQETIESELVFPALRGSDISRWKNDPVIDVLITQNKDTRAGYEETLMKANWPHTYSYLLRFREVLMTQAAYKKYHEEQNNPFYSQYNIANYTYTRYKTVWKQMHNDIVACVISQHKTVYGYKSLIPLHTTAFFATESEHEAHYLCAIINSTPVRDFIKSYSSAGRGFGTPSVMNHVGIKKFDPNNKLHQKLAKISTDLHDLKKKEETDFDVQKLETENDQLVTELFGL